MSVQTVRGKQVIKVFKLGLTVLGLMCLIDTAAAQETGERSGLIDQVEALAASDQTFPSYLVHGYSNAELVSFLITINALARVEVIEDVAQRAVQNISAHLDRNLDSADPSIVEYNLVKGDFECLRILLKNQLNDADCAFQGDTSRTSCDRNSVSDCVLRAERARTGDGEPVSMMLAADYYARAAVMQLENGNRDSAIRYFEQAMEIYPDLPGLSDLVGKLFR